jgi:Leucine-rich repeat (LRR) protein
MLRFYQNQINKNQKMNLLLSFLMIFLFITLNAMTEAYENAHDYFTNRNFCAIKSTRTYQDHFNLISLKCDWNAFVNSFDDKNRFFLEKPVVPILAKNRKLNNYYEIEFYLQNHLQQRNRSKRVVKDLFKNFNIKSLKLSGLNLEQIDEDAFNDKKSFSLLESLDLSMNNLKRLDAQTLSKLNNLENLNLSFNPYFSLDNNNFNSNKYLSLIDLSHNNIQYLPPRAFNGLNSVQKIDLSYNSIKTIDSCTFNTIQLNPISSKYSPSLIDLKSNPIKCDCNLFYLNRVRNVKFDLQCETKYDYGGLKFDDLFREDPSQRCQYDKIRFKCEFEDEKYGTITGIHFITVFTLCLIILILLLIIIVCCCKNGSLNKKLNQLKDEKSKNKGSKKFFTKNAHCDREILIK